MDGLTFVTSRERIITSVGTKKWDAFATENGAPELQAEFVVGRCLLDFIAGPDVQDQLKRIMQSLSQDPDGSWVMHFRCDAPELKRNMRQALKPIFSVGTCAGFLFQSVELYTQKRPAIDLFNFKEVALKAAEHPDSPIVMMCSWCHWVQYEPVCGAEWIEAEDYYAAGGSSKVHLTHGICEGCLQSETESI